MDIAFLTTLFMKYGWIAIFTIVFLEYLNLPGFPAGVIMPLAGIMASKGNIGFVAVMLLSVAAGLLGSLCLYALGRFGGSKLLPWYYKKFPAHQETIEKNIDWLKEKGCIAVFIAKLLPAVRTLISIPAGIIEMDLKKYVITSTCGIMIWNFVFVGAGFVMGDEIFEMTAKIKDYITAWI